jgi:hypothetical protein
VERRESGGRANDKWREARYARNGRRAAAVGSVGQVAGGLCVWKRCVVRPRSILSSSGMGCMQWGRASVRRTLRPKREAVCRTAC